MIFALESKGNGGGRSCKGSLQTSDQTSFSHQFRDLTKKVEGVFSLILYCTVLLD